MSENLKQKPQDTSGLGESYALAAERPVGGSLMSVVKGREARKWATEITDLLK